MEFIDSHCHLHLPWFDNNKIKSVIKDARTNSVTHIVNCSSDPQSFKQVVESGSLSDISVTLGLQPTLANELTNADQIREVLERGTKIVAIGEVGLDYYWVKDDSKRLRQESLFQSAIELATEYKLPLVVHSRKAESRCLDVLEKFAHTPVLLHSFEGNLEEVNRSLDLGYLISIPTNVVIRKNRRKVAKRAGLENIVLETDSPFCAPSPDIKENTPKNIPIAAKKLCEVMDSELDDLSKVILKTTKQFYQI
ncbi:MAG: TatD family hydrolase [Candidatus Heimdallarchaeota archaeon]|nr:TatD family hydrolase [Candidatus Heimdallarchaeota archaeon]